MNKETLNFIGLMHRAGALITGTELVLNGVRSQKVKLVLIDAHVSEKTFKKMTDKCKFYHVSFIKVDGGKLGHAIGNTSRKVVGVTDPHFTKALLKKIEKQEATIYEST